MSSLLAANVDFLVFLYGSVFFFLAAVAVIPRLDRAAALPWGWLAAFAALRGLHKWLSLSYCALPQWPYASLDAALLLISFFLLAEFGRRTLTTTRWRAWARPWWYLLLPIALAFMAGSDAADIESAIRPFFGLPAAWISAFALFEVSRATPERTPRSALLFSALFLFAYGLAASISINALDVDPAILFGVGTARVPSGVILETLRTLFVAGIAGGVWTFVVSATLKNLARDGMHPPPRMRMAALIVIALAIATWFGANVMRNYADRSFKQTLTNHALDISSLLDAALQETIASPTADKDSEPAQLLGAVLRNENEDAEIDTFSLLALRDGALIELAHSGVPLLARGMGDEVPNYLRSLFMKDNRHSPQPRQFYSNRALITVVPALLESKTGRALVVLAMEISASHYARLLASQRLIAFAIGGLFILLALDVLAQNYRQWIRILRSTRELAETNAHLSAERELHQEAENKYRTLTDNLPVILYRVDYSPTPHTSFISPQLRALLGISPEEWMADPLRWLTQIHESDRERIRITVQAADRQTKPVTMEYRIHDNNGALHWIRNNIRYQTSLDGRPRYAYGVMLDITEHVQVIQKLRESSERYRLLFEHSPAGLFHYDKDMRITDLNNRFASFMDRPRRELIGFDLRAAADAEVTDMLQSALRGGEGFREGARGFATMAEDAWTSILTAPLLSSTGAVVGGIAIVQDLSQQRRVEEELMRTQKIESLGLLAGGLAHDFNNILTAILGNISLARQSDSAEDIALSLQDAETASRRAQELARQLLTFAKGGAPLRQLRNVAAVIREAAGFTVRGSASHCVYALAPDTWEAEIDAGQITQVVQNLIINADQAMPNGGTIHIETHNRVLAHNEVPALPPGRYVEVRISDTGAGIPDRIKGRIFDPYFSTKPKGSGLGLTMCYSIIQKHGGHILVASAEGRGTTFTLFLPAATEIAAPPTPPASPQKPPTGSGRILIMDDEDSILNLCRRILERSGYTVLTAARGEEAIRIYDEEVAAGRSIDLAILDITVPAGLGGRETLSALRQRDPNFPALVSSGYAKDEALSEFKAAGFSGAIPKPYRANDLIAAVHTALTHKHTPPQHPTA